MQLKRLDMLSTYLFSCCNAHPPPTPLDPKVGGVILVVGMGVFQQAVSIWSSFTERKMMFVLMVSSSSLWDPPGIIFHVY